ncbi:MAG: hypothetical protein ACTSPQ_22180, partial [Candidatus Helarchaeota archaeon]
FYFLFNFLDDLLELKDHIGLWIGDIRRRNDNLYFQSHDFFDDDIPRDQSLYLTVWSPFLFPTDLKIRLENTDSGTIITDCFDHPNIRQNLNDFFEIFSQNKILPVIIGEFPIKEFMRNYRRQQSAIWHAANFAIPRNEDESIEQYELRVLQRRLAQNDRRAGEAIFGNRVRFI